MKGKIRTTTSAGVNESSISAPPAPGVGNRFGALIERYLSAMTAGDERAESDCGAALGEMRKHPWNVIVALTRAEARSDRSDYWLRWALVYLAVQLKHEAALPYFRDLLLTPIPPEASETPDSFSTVRHETILRTTAIKGVGYLAARGNQHAVDALFEALQIPSLSVCRAAVQALLAANPNLRARIGHCLPRDLHFLLDLKTSHVSEVPEGQGLTKEVQEKMKRVAKFSAPM
jgi:hypothetical protein